MWMINFIRDGSNDEGRWGLKPGTEIKIIDYKTLKRGKEVINTYNVPINTEYCKVRDFLNSYEIVEYDDYNIKPPINRLVKNRIIFEIDQYKGNRFDKKIKKKMEVEYVYIHPYYYVINLSMTIWTKLGLIINNVPKPLWVFEIDRPGISLDFIIKKLIFTFYTFALIQGGKVFKKLPVDILNELYSYII